MSEWTIGTLKEFEDLKIKALEERTCLQFQLNQTALEKTELEVQIHIRSLDEWRIQLRDERTTFATRLEMQYLTKIVYIGMGILLALEFVLRYYLR